MHNLSILLHLTLIYSNYILSKLKIILIKLNYVLTLLKYSFYNTSLLNKTALNDASF